MKKFRFSLESVLDYKQQALDSLKREHSAIVAQVKAQEDYLAGLESDYREMDAEFCQRKLEGIAVLDAMRYEQYLRAMERQIQQAILRLEDLRRLEEAKRAEVVSAKQDTSAIEKLKDKKLDSRRARRLRSTSSSPRPAQWPPCRWRNRFIVYIAEKGVGPVSSE